jgi:hypothetical protein
VVADRWHFLTHAPHTDEIGRSLLAAGGSIPQRCPGLLAHVAVPDRTPKKARNAPRALAWPSLANRSDTPSTAVREMQESLGAHQAE